jgi:hypothetical protein
MAKTTFDYGCRIFANLNTGYTVKQFMLKTMNDTNIMCDKDCQFKQNQTRQHLLHHVQQDIPTVIEYDQLHLLPSRLDFVDAKLKNAFDALTNKSQPVLFMPTSVQEKNDYVDGIMTYRVYLFGILPCGSKACVVLSDVPVHVDVMVPADTTYDKFRDTISGQLIEKILHTLAWNA